MKKLVLLAAVVLSAACGSTPTEPTHAVKKAPNAAHDEVLECRSGYLIAYDESGSPYCKVE